MKTLIQSIGLLIFFLLILSWPATAAYYDQNGVKVNEEQYEKILKTRAGEMDKINQNGYAESSKGLEDPVRLRNRRIDQWKSRHRKGRGK